MQGAPDQVCAETVGSLQKKGVWSSGELSGRPWSRVREGAAGGVEPRIRSRVGSRGKSSAVWKLMRKYFLVKRRKL